MLPQDLHLHIDEDCIGPVQWETMQRTELPFQLAIDKILKGTRKNLETLGTDFPRVLQLKETCLIKHSIFINVKFTIAVESPK